MPVCLLPFLPSCLFACLSAAYFLACLFAAYFLACLFVCLPVSLLNSLLVYLFVYLPVYLLACLSAYFLACLSVCHLACIPVCLPAPYLFPFLSACLPVYPFLDPQFHPAFTPSPPGTVEKKSSVGHLRPKPPWCISISTRIINVDVNENDMIIMRYW